MVPLYYGRVQNSSQMTPVFIHMNSVRIFLSYFFKGKLKLSLWTP